MKIKVTKKHIKEGKRRDCKKCPIALAILEQSGFDTVEVTGMGETELSKFIPVKGRKRPFVAKFESELPVKAADFIMAFDEKEHVEPFTFELRPVPLDIS